MKFGLWKTDWFLGLVSALGAVIALEDVSVASWQGTSFPSIPFLIR